MPRGLPARSDAVEVGPGCEGPLANRGLAVSDRVHAWQRRSETCMAATE